MSKKVFLVPYRDREPQRFFFQNYMTYILEDFTEGEDYEIFFVQQNDSRPFNRGAMKNIGFLAIRDKYPDSYKDITFVFHDVDVMPYKKDLIDYEATPGTISHYYGFRFALGGIFAIKGGDFERINGFANYWTWGFEDNLIQNRAQRAGLFINRDNFFELNDMRILHINDGNRKTLNRNYMYELVQDSGENGLQTITNLNYTINVGQNLIDVTCFDVEYSPWQGKFEDYDIRKGRDIHAPITKDMVLANARKGNHLDTLFFINEKGERQGTRDLLEQEKREMQEMQEKQEKSRHWQPRALMMSGIKKNEQQMQIRRNDEFMRGRRPKQPMVQKQSMQRLGMFRK